MGYTDEDITMLAEVIDSDQYEEILKGLDGDSELEKFTREFVNSVQKEVQGREIAEWSYLGHRKFVDKFFPESARERRTERGEKIERSIVRFSISRYPVTNEQYHDFVEETRHKQPEHWHDYTDLEYLVELGDYPVVNVSWMDAMAYCKWLSEKTGKKYGLPTEAQWEKAARGVSGQPFPWGNLKDKFICNTSESGHGTIVSVGLNAPLDDSPYLVADMIGNVWEWTSSLYEPYPYEPEDGREDMHKPGPRVLRGGSFIDILGAVCCSARHSADPDLRLKNVGFRVVMFR
jgi:formylglycine-generating enzyme required for sulfatase activity